MNTNEIFTLGLGLEHPWKLQNVRFEAEDDKKILVIDVGFQRGCKFTDPASGPFARFARTVRAHWGGIVNYIQTRINNGVLEGINSQIQLVKRRARSYRNTTNFINIIYFTCGRLKFDYPQYLT